MEYHWEDHGQCAEEKEWGEEAHAERSKSQIPNSKLQPDLVFIDCLRCLFLLENDDSSAVPSDGAAYARGGNRIGPIPAGAPCSDDDMQYQAADRPLAASC